MVVEFGASRQKRNISVGTKALLQAISAAAAAAVAPGAVAVAVVAAAGPSIIEAAFNILESSKPTLSSKAWQIVRSTYALALVRFFATVELSKKPSKSELQYLLEALLNRADILAEMSPDTLSLEHLQQPLKVRIFRDFAQAIPDELRHFGPLKSANQNRRLFEQCVFEAFIDVRNNKSEQYAEVEQALDSSIGIAAEKRQAASNHEAYLIRAFSQIAVFGQEESGITLSQLYVRQRCLWKKPIYADSSEERGDGFQNSKRPEVVNFEFHLSDIHQELDNWLAANESNDSIRVVGGGPGSGKSTFARAFAIEAIDSAQFDVLFIPLQELEPSGSFDSRVSNLFGKRTELGFDRVNSPLDWMGRSETDGSPPKRPLLLICDGLDELAPPDTKEAANATTDFIQSLNVWLANRNSGGLYARALVLGRTIAAEEAFAKLGIDHSTLLSVAGFLPLDENEHWQNAKERSDAYDPLALAGKDQRHDYWQNWCNAKGEALPLPVALTDSATDRAVLQLTAEPLLLYLLLWTGYLSDRWEEAAQNRNVVYRVTLPPAPNPV